LCRELRARVERTPPPPAVGDEVILPTKLDMGSQILYHIYSMDWTDPTAIHSVIFLIERECFSTTFEIPVEYEIYVEYDCAPELAGVVSGRPSFATPHSDGCFDLIKTWVRECTEHHRYYCPSQLENPLPTRVLDIGIGGGDDSIFLKVANPREVGAYVTLSHCVSIHFSTSLVLFVACRLRNKDLIKCLRHSGDRNHTFARQSPISQISGSRFH
jgi:hypothetical protein